MASRGASPNMSLLRFSLLVCSVLFFSDADGLTFQPIDRSSYSDIASVDCSAAFYGENLQVERAPAAIRLGLVHKDGLCSPLRTSSSFEAEFELTEQFLIHEANRVSFLQSKLGLNVGMSELGTADAPVVSGASMGSGNYLVKVGLGMPAKELMLVIDTGSEVLWTQCTPCASGSACYSQMDAIFNPAASSTYKEIPCGGAACATLGSSSAAGCSGGSCQYQVNYLDGSFTKGDFASDVLTVGPAMVDGYEFGCGHDNEGLFKGFDGVIGLDKSANAFPAQTKASFGETFAYCLPSTFSTSSGFIEFGTSASPSSSRTTLNTISSALYVADLTSVSVGSASISPSTSSAPLIIDSGTVITRLSTGLYNDLRDSFKSSVSGLTLVSSSAGGGLFDTCYTVSSSVQQIPKISFILAGGVAFSPPAESLLYPLSGGVYCLAFAPIDSSGGVSILGNFQQQHYRFAFDIPSNTLSIDANAC